jgi:hypothetical protein
MEASPADGYQECFLQEIIDRWPSVLPASDFYPGIQALYSLGREIPVPIAGTSEGSIDNLLVADDGHLIIVETKLLRNPESTRAVVAQALQYGMSVSQLSLEEFERCIRRGQSCPEGLTGDETVAERTRKAISVDDEFEDRFDVYRRRGEILLLIAADGIHQSAGRLVGWMNGVVGTSPIRLGMVEFEIYNLPDGNRLVTPKTLTRIREASRHVVAIELRGGSKDQVQVTVTGDDALPSTQKPAARPSPISEDELTRQIRAGNPTEIADLAETLIVKLKASGLQSRGLPSSLQFGVSVNRDFIPLVTLGPTSLWVQIPVRAVRVLGDQRFVACKQQINRVASFYRSEDVADPGKLNALSPRYQIVKGKAEAFVSAIAEIAHVVRYAFVDAGV